MGPGIGFSMKGNEWWAIFVPHEMGSFENWYVRRPGFDVGWVIGELKIMGKGKIGEAGGWMGVFGAIKCSLKRRR